MLAEINILLLTVWFLIETVPLIADRLATAEIARQGDDERR